MATTIQIVEDIRVGQFIEIEGHRCEVERASSFNAIDRKNALEELVMAMQAELLERKLIAKDQSGAFFWTETGEPLISEEDYEE